MESFKTTPGKWYCFTCTAAAKLTADIEGTPLTIAETKVEGQITFCAPTDEVFVETGAPYNARPTDAPAGAFGGGCIKGDLIIGHGAADAVAAVCTLTLGDLAQGGTLADTNGQSVELEPPHAYATGQVDIADATEAGTLAIGDWSKEWEAQPRREANMILTPLESYDGEETPYKFSTTDEYKTCEFEWYAPAGSTVQDLKGAINDEDGTPHWRNGPPMVDASINGEGKLVLTAKVFGARGNGTKVTPSDNTPFELSDEVEFTNGQDARSPQEVVDTLNDSGDCTAVAVLDHVEAQDAKAVLTPKESYYSGMTYDLFILENGEEVNNWAWDARDGDTVQELLAALNDDQGRFWYNTRDIEATLEDGKVVLRRLGVHGDASNGYVVQPWTNTPFAEIEETPIEGGRDESDTITFTAKEYGVNDTITITGGLFENEQGMSGGHGDYTVDELLEAIGGEFTDITAAAGSAEGTITLTANTAGKAANAVTYTATGCFGSGTVRQGSTTRGKDAVEQTDYKIYLNGEELDVEPAPLPVPLAPATAMKNGGVYTVAAQGTALDFSDVTLAADYASAEVWLTCTATTTVTWPVLWSWVDGIVPPCQAGNRYFVRVWTDGHAVVAELKYSYADA